MGDGEEIEGEGVCRAQGGVGVRAEPLREPMEEEEGRVAEAGRCAPNPLL